MIVRIKDVASIVLPEWLSILISEFLYKLGDWSYNNRKWNLYQTSMRWSVEFDIYCIVWRMGG